VPQGSDAARLQLAEQSLGAMADTWAKAAETCPADAYNRMSAEELAVEFCRTVYAHSALIEFAITSDWISRNYPLMCRAFGLARPPPFKDFAKELANLLSRKRWDRRSRDGKRRTDTIYAIRHPTLAVALAEAQRKGNARAARRWASASATRGDDVAAPNATSQ
jgi:hypothetical protein